MARTPLGKGLDELLKSHGVLGETGEQTTQLGRVIEVSIERIEPNPLQPRSRFNQETLEELAASIRETGVLQPLIVRPAADGRYQLIAGERRWRAAGLARVETVPIVVRDVSDEEAVAFALIENIQREDLNVVDEAQAYGRLNEEFGLTHEEIGQMLGKARATITNRMRLRELIPEVLNALRGGDIEMGHARALLALEPHEQAQVKDAIIQRHISVRNTEQLIKRLRKRKTAKPKVSPDTLRLERELSDKIGAPLAIRMSGRSNKKGSVVIKFTNLDELDGILEHLRRK
ncbi:MAG: ParB/RepB/Spo0J family partition protein [Gammaproteobacteria bacterium]|nr:ParB/RepB/Spo0J family partition protein [Gammaproteobacteria bacterium]